MTDPASSEGALGEGSRTLGGGDKFVSPPARPSSTRTLGADLERDRRPDPRARNGYPFHHLRRVAPLLDSADHVAVEARIVAVQNADVLGPAVFVHVEDEVDDDLRRGVIETGFEATRRDADERLRVVIFARRGIGRRAGCGPDGGKRGFGWQGSRERSRKRQAPDMP